MTEEERICRAIDEALYGPRPDDEWQSRWEWHTCPRHVRLGGEWMVLTAARAAMKAIGTGDDEDIQLVRRFLELARGVRSISFAKGKEEIDPWEAREAFERILARAQ